MMTIHLGTTRQAKPFTSEIIRNKVLLEFKDMDTNKPKHKQLEKVTCLLKYEQKFLLDFLAKKIHKERIPNQKSERITANSLVRVLVDILNEKQNDISLSNIQNEEELKAEIKKCMTR